MDQTPPNLPRVIDDVMPPVTAQRDNLLRMLLSRATTPGSVRYTRVEQWEIVGTPALAHPSTTRNRLALAMGAAALVVITAVTTWWLAAQPPAPSKVAGVTVALPAARAPASNGAAKAPAAPPAATAVAAIAPAAPAVAALPQPDQSGVPASQSAALARAFATNESWPWQGETSRGMVVVGPGEIVAGRLCRDVAIMTRGDGIPDRTANSRKCQEPGGVIVDADPAR